MNPGNAGVRVSFPRKEINERNRERRRITPVISVTQEVYLKLDRFFF